MDITLLILRETTTANPKRNVFEKYRGDVYTRQTFTIKRNNDNHFYDGVDVESRVNRRGGQRVKRAALVSRPSTYGFPAGKEARRLTVHATKISSQLILARSSDAKNRVHYNNVALTLKTPPSGRLSQYVKPTSVRDARSGSVEIYYRGQRTTSGGVRGDAGFGGNERRLFDERRVSKEKGDAEKTMKTVVGKRHQSGVPSGPTKEGRNTMTTSGERC